MSTTTLVIDVTDAEFEIARRKAPKGTDARLIPPTPQAKVCARMSGAELRDLAGVVAEVAVKAKASATKVKAAKPKRSAAEKKATIARSAAWEFMIGEKKAGRACTYVEACAKYGTTPAKVKA